MGILKAYEKVLLVEHQKWLTLDASSEGRLSLAWRALPLPPMLDRQRGQFTKATFSQVSVDPLGQTIGAVEREL